MKPGVPMLMGLALVWSGLALAASCAVPAHDWQLLRSMAYDARQSRPRDAEGLQSAVAKGMDGSDGSPVAQASSGVAAETWRTAGDDWTQGELQGAATIAESKGLSLTPGNGEGVCVSAPRTLPFPINAVAAELRGNCPSGSSTEVEVRVGADGQHWSSWQDLPPSHEDEGGPNLWVSELIGVSIEGAGPTAYIQYRVRLAPSSRGDVPTIEMLDLTLIDSTAGPGLKAAKSALLPSGSDGGIPRPPVISRAGWGADESLMSWQPEYEQAKKVIIHHTVTQNTDSPASVRAIYYYHAVTRGWGDIGYNYLIDPAGNIYEGRTGGEGVVGGHALKCNYGSIGIALIGDFTQRTIPQAMEEALIEMLAWIANRYGIAPQGQSVAWGSMHDNILGHRDVQSTSCPGQQAYQRLPYWRAMAAQRLLAHAPEVAVEMPLSGGAVTGTVDVKASSSSPLLAGLSLYVDQELVSTSDESPLVWAWDTTSWSDGEHVLEAVAHGFQELDGRLTNTLVVDNSPPHGGLAINGGTLLTSVPDLSLGMAAADSGIGVKYMELAEDGEWQGREQFSYQRGWMVSPGDGVRQMAVRFWDGAGNVSPIYTETVVLDTTPPTWDDASATDGGSVYIGVQDTLSGLVSSSVEYELATGMETDWSSWQPADCSGPDGSTDQQVVGASPTVPAGSTIRFRAMDRAGNWSVSPACALHGAWN